jgi:hypothetical protein
VLVKATAQSSSLERSPITEHETRYLCNGKDPTRIIKLYICLSDLLPTLGILIEVLCYMYRGDGKLVSDLSNRGHDIGKRRTYLGNHALGAIQTRNTSNVLGQIKHNTNSLNVTLTY